MVCVDDGLVDGDGVERFVLGRLLLALRAPLAEAAAARPREHAAKLLTSQKSIIVLSFDYVLLSHIQEEYYLQQDPLIQIVLIVNFLFVLSQLLI